MKVKSESEVAQSCLTLSDPMDCGPPGPPSMGFSRQEYWSGVPLPSPTVTSLTSTNSNILQSPYLQVHKFTKIDGFPVQQLIQRFTEYLLCGKHYGGPKN